MQNVIKCKIKHARILQHSPQSYTHTHSERNHSSLLFFFSQQSVALPLTHTLTFRTSVFFPIDFHFLLLAATMLLHSFFFCQVQLVVVFVIAWWSIINVCSNSILSENLNNGYDDGIVVDVLVLIGVPLAKASSLRGVPNRFLSFVCKPNQLANVYSPCFSWVNESVLYKMMAASWLQQFCMCMHSRMCWAGCAQSAVLVVCVYAFVTTTTIDPRL